MIRIFWLFSLFFSLCLSLPVKAQMIYVDGTNYGAGPAWYNSPSELCDVLESKATPGKTTYPCELTGIEYRNLNLDGKYYTNLRYVRAVIPVAGASNPTTYYYEMKDATPCAPGEEYDTGTNTCSAPVTDEECQSRSGITHVQNVSAEDFFSGSVTQVRVSKDECEYSWDSDSPEALDCYQKTDGSFQCYLAMTPENAGQDEVAAVEPIEGDGDAVEVEASTETDNQTGITVEGSTTVQKEPDGTEITTDTNTKTDPDGTVTETVTEKKKNPDGTVTTIVNQTITYPDGTKETTISGTKTETPENDEDKRSASLGDCGAPVQCKGDAIDCAILEQQKKDYCATEKGVEDAKDLIEQNTSGVGKLGDEGLDLTDSTEINLSEKMGDWQNVADPTPGQCPADREISLSIGTYQLSWQPWCDFAATIRPFTIFMFSFIGAMAIARTFTS